MAFLKCCRPWWLVALIFAESLSGGSPAYKATVIPLPPIPYPRVQVKGLNNNGQVLGVICTPDCSTGPIFVGDGTTVNYLPLPPGARSANPMAINDEGQVVVNFSPSPLIGSATGLLPVDTTPKCSWSAQTNRWVFGWESTMATGLNDSGQLVGFGSYCMLAETYPFVSAVNVSFIGTAGGITPLPRLPEWSQLGVYATDINVSGQVVGVVSGANGNGLFVGTAAGVRPIPLPAGLSAAMGIDSSEDLQRPHINGLGQVLVNVFPTSPGWPIQPYVWTPSLGFSPIATTPGCPTGWGEGINDVGQVVGYGTGPGISCGPFVATTHDITYLNSIVPGWSIFYVRAINNKGQIAAEAFDSTGAYHAVRLDPATSIDGTKMFDSHTLEVDVTTQFSRDATTPKSITLEATVNGVPVTSTYPILSASGPQSKKLFIDFVGNRIPRFSDNQSFKLTATVVEAGNTIGSAATLVEIPLPVVHVHGILTDCLPKRIPTSLFTYLKGVHPSYTEDDSFPTLTQTYPTLVSFDYHSLSGDAIDSAGQLSSWIQREVLATTYANKVDIIAHSLGGIISRAAIADFGAGQFINRLILVGSPSEGATIAPIALSNWGLTQGIAAALLLPAALVPEVKTALGCLMGGKPVTTQQMLPTYPWFANTESAAVQGQLTIPINDFNTFLGVVNYGLDPNVSYYAIVASGIQQTPTLLWGRFWVFGPTAALHDATSAAYGPGDGIVPIRSQRASDTGWPIGTGPGRLNIFDDVGPVFHTAYFDQFQVQLDVETILWP